MEGDESTNQRQCIPCVLLTKGAPVYSATEKGGEQLPRVHTVDVQDVELQGAPGPQEPHLLTQQPAAAHHQGHVVQQLGQRGSAPLTVTQQ